MNEIQGLHKESQIKLYPISHLVLGPQNGSKDFGTVYKRLPNFHPIHEADNEAFTTGKMVSFQVPAAALSCCLGPAACF